MLIRPSSPCHPTQAMTGPIFSHIWNPSPAFPGGVNDFHGRLYPGLGRPHGRFPDFGCFDPLRTLELKAVILGLQHSLNVIADHLSRPNQPITTEWSLHPEIMKQIFGTWGTQVCHSPQHASSPVYVSSSRASSTGDRCSVTRLAGEVDVHVSTVPPAQPSHSEAQYHPGGRSDTNSPLVAITTVVSTSTMSVCGPSSLLSEPP